MNSKPPSTPMSEGQRTPPGAASAERADPEVSAGAGALFRRSLVALMLIAVWGAVGLAARLSPDAYLLIGIPLMLVFQRYIARKPLCSAWDFDGYPLRWGGLTWLAGLAVAAGPGWLLFSQVQSAHEHPLGIAHVLWCLTAMVGAFIGVATIRAQRRAAAFRQMPLIVFTLIIGCGLMVSGKFSLPNGGIALPSPTVSPALAWSLACTFFGISFLTEEVAFRGLLDPYLRQVARGPTQEFVSALVGSALWAAWHLPVASAFMTLDPVTVIRLFALHIGLGILLCFIARGSGTLAPSSLVHVLIDTVRESF